MDIKNVVAEYRGNTAPLDEVINRPIGNIVTVPDTSTCSPEDRTLRISFVTSMCVGCCVPLCCFVPKCRNGYGNPIKKHLWMNPEHEWPVASLEPVIVQKQPKRASGPARGPVGTVSPKARLSELKSMLDDGMITQEEFGIKKESIIAEM